MLKIGIIKIKSHFRYVLYALLSMSMFTACGYKPVSHYTSKSIVQPLYLELKISSREPDGGVFIKDALRQAIIYRLGVKTSSKQASKSKLTIKYDNISYTALGYDSNGYVERYRVNMITQYHLESDNQIIDRKIKTTYEADVSPSALESSKAKQEAIKACAKKAVDQFIAFIAAYSLKD